MNIEPIENNFGVMQVPGGWRIVERVSADGAYITYPELFEKRDNAILSVIRRGMRMDGLERDAEGFRDIRRELGDREQCLVAAKFSDDGEWYLLTRRVFTSREAAKTYAATFDDAIVITAVRPISPIIAS